MLAKCVQLPVIEAEDKQLIMPGHIYVAPSNYHLLVEGTHLALSTEAPVRHARPSIDVLFESAADSVREGLLGVLLTGMSRDGTAGLKRIKQQGGFTVVQDPVTAEGRLMPEAAIESEVVNKIWPLQKIAAFLMDFSDRQRMRA
jgi:two-component system chemotaxis response regulator CheB